ncbi:MAG: M48 family metallopeptidase [Dysgonomonas sp.]
MAESFTDNDFGEVLVVRNRRSKRIIARRTEQGIKLTVPLSYPLNKVIKVFCELKPRIEKLKSTPKLFFDESTTLETVSFSLLIRKENTQNFYVVLKDNVLNITCPSHCDFSDESVQSRIRKILENTLRSEAKRIIPARVESHAARNNFEYASVKINKSHTRWGSCSSKKSINLSIYCMLLPLYLLDFVILHELCHTVELNHGTRFWKLLDSVTEDKARTLTEELKNFKANL